MITIEDAIVQVEPHLAPVWRRLLGYLIDVACGIALGILFVSNLSPSEQAEVGPIFLLVTPFYFTFFPEAVFGRSLGKLLTGTKVVRLRGGKPGWGWSFVRMLLRFIPLEFLSMKKGIMWHDKFSGTRVVKRSFQW